MSIFRLAAAFGLALIVSACTSVETPTRNTPFDTAQKANTSSQQGRKSEKATDGTVAVASVLTPKKTGASPVRVQSVSVTVPRALKVSESNSFLPRGDIVWREDPIGDRHAQVQKIVYNALVRGVRTLNGPVPVKLDVQVVKFHALTEKARYTTGGVHAITFILSIKDARTGELVVPARKVRADLEAYGGAQALRAEALGQTQKVRISAQISEVIRQELTNPEGFKNATKGFIQSWNYL